MQEKSPLQKERILKGIITLLILRMTAVEPMHGYSLQQAISKEIKREMPQGSIYVLLKTLEKRDFIRVHETEPERDRKTYVITERGLDFLVAHSEPLSIARNVMKDLIEFIDQLKNKREHE